VRQLRSARARREDVVVSVDIVDALLFVLLSVAAVPVEPVVPLVVPVEPLVLPVAPDGVLRLVIVDELVGPVAVPVARVGLSLLIVALLFIDPLVVPVAPGLGAVLWALLLGEPEAPP